MQVSKSCYYQEKDSWDEVSGIQKGKEEMGEGRGKDRERRGRRGREEPDFMGFIFANSWLLNKAR